MVEQAANQNQESSEDDWEANAESWEDMDAVPAIGPAAGKAKLKVCCYAHDVMVLMICTCSHEALSCVH